MTNPSCSSSLPQEPYGFELLDFVERASSAALTQHVLDHIAGLRQTLWDSTVISRVRSCAHDANIALDMLERRDCDLLSRESSRRIQLQKELEEVQVAFETERTMHAAWRKRAEEAEFHGLVPVDPKLLESFKAVMENEVIPEIVRTLRERQRAAIASRDKVL